MFWIFVVTSARLASSFDFVLPLSRDQLRQRSDLAGLHAAHAGSGLRGGLGLALRDDVLLLLAELPGRGVGVLGRGVLVGQRLLELRLVRLGQLRLADVGTGHLLVGLRACPPRGWSARPAPASAPPPPPGSDTADPGSSGPIGVTGFGTAFDWSGGASVAVSMSLDWPSLPCVTSPEISPFTSPALPDSL